MELSGITALSETLLIPLAARARETGGRSPVVSDPKAVEILANIDTGTRILDGGPISTQGILARTMVIDRELDKILSQNPHAVILNLGAGLDTRVCRMHLDGVQWYDLDFPQVLELRQSFFKQSPWMHSIAGSVLEPLWPNQVAVPENHATIMIAEGLLMYFTQEEVKALLALLASHFPGAWMFFDVVHSYFVNKGISSTFRWGLDHAADVEALHPQIKLVQAWSTGNLLRERQPALLRLLNLLPATRNRSQILQIKLEP